ncbi:hypothetical protein O0544_17220 [Edwardsiella anguillarum]|nr:hypothetical protein [Edwardsiella anguillarum]
MQGSINDLTYTGGLGDPLKAREAYYRDEVIPLHRLIMEGVNADPDIGGLGG